MKKAISALVIFFFCICVLCACGDYTEDSVLRDYWLIEPTEIAIATPELTREWRLLGAHYVDDEAIQIWGQSIRNELLQGFWDVYVYHEDGGSEFKFGGITSSYRDGWYMDGDGGFYIALGNELVKLDSEGKEVFHREYDRNFKTMYQDRRGNWLVLGETEGGTLITAEVNGETGELTDKSSIVLDDDLMSAYYAGQTDGIYMLDQKGVWKLNFEDGTKEPVLSFEEYHYTWDVYPKNFRVVEGTPELLLEGRKIALTKVNMADRRTVLFLRSVLDMPNIDEAIASFNKENDTYYVAWEKIGEKEGIAAYKEKVGIEVSTGGGPDLMFVGGAVMPNNIADYMEKGVFEKLNPYMEQSGITEENYFRSAFSGLTDGEDVYGITILVQLGGDWVSSAVLGDTETPTIEELIDALLVYDEKAVFRKKSDASSLLNYFLMASDSIHGAVDWESGTCNFENELFRKILKVCLRYEDDRNNDYPALTGSMADGYYGYVLLEERLAQGQVPIWYFFDEGCCPGGRIFYTMAINSNSPHKEGAWTFIEYLLNGELQSTYSDVLFPVKRSGYDEIISKEMEEGSFLWYKDAGNIVHTTLKAGLDGYENVLDAHIDIENYRAKHDITEEKAKEISQLLEKTRTLPVRTQAILNIISQEADAYFLGQKNIDEVCALIQNRVQLYLDEKN